MCHLDRHPLSPCLFGTHICPTGYDPAPAVLSVLTTQSGPVQPSNGLRQPSRAILVRRDPGSLNASQGKSLLLHLYGTLAGALVRFYLLQGRNYAGFLQASWLHGWKVGSGNPLSNWLVMLCEERGCCSQSRWARVRDFVHVATKQVLQPYDERLDTTGLGDRDLPELARMYTAVPKYWD